MIRRFFRHIKEGFYGVGRHLGMALSSASAVTITLTLIALFLVLMTNLFSMTRTIESSVAISALIAEGAEPSREIIQQKIEDIPGVEEVTYSSKEQEFDYYLESYVESGSREFIETFRDKNPFNDALIVKVEDGRQLAEIKKAINKIDGIESTYDGGVNTYTLINVLANVRVVGGGLVLALCALAIYLVYNTIKITIASRKDEIWIMRNVGAKNGYIRAPFLVEGIIIGSLGAIIPILLAVFGYIYVFKSLDGSVFGAFALIPPHPYILYIAGILLLIGIVVGFVGSYISVCKYLRLKR